MSRWEVFGSLMAMVFLVNFVRVVFAPLLQPVAAEFQVATAALGLVTSAVWLGSAAPRLPTGYLLTRVPRHWVIAGAGALLVITATFTAVSTSVLQLTIGAFLMGLSSGMYFVSANPLLSELFPERISRTIGLHGMSMQMGAVMAPLIVAGILFVADWRTTFFGVAIAAAITTVILLYAARWTNLPGAGERDRSLRAAARSQWRIILTGIAFVGGVGFLWNAWFNLYGDYLEVAKNIDPGNGRVFLSIMFAAGVPAFFFAGRMGERFSNVPLVMLYSIMFTGSIVLLTFVESVLWIVIISCVIGFSFFLIPPTLDTYLLSSLPDQHRGSAYAVYSSIMMIIHALGSGAVGSAVASGMTYSTMFRVVAGVVGLVVVGLYIAYRVDRLPTN